MSLDSHLIHRCVIARSIVTGEDPLGGPGAETTQTVYSGPCRYVEREERIAGSDRAEVTIVKRLVLLLPLMADVKEQDRVTSITADGGPVGGVHRITSVLQRRSGSLHHKSVELERI